MSRKADKVPEHRTAAGKHAGKIPSLTSVCTRQQRIAAIAQKYIGKPITTLHHHLDMLWMREAFKRLNPKSVAGIDEQSVKDYAVELESNLRSLLERAKKGTYRAPPVKRKHIPKNEKETRPIGIPTTENKVLERAVVMLLEPIYEIDFIECSYGFRVRRSAHQALESIRQWLMQHGGGWVLDVDIRKYFDTIDHAHLRKILRQRIKDGVILRLIDKWLKAGVWEDGHLSYPEVGSPQGGVISPMLSNIYLHEVLDEWFIGEVVPELQGQAHLVRFADDFVILFTEEAEAREVKAQLPERFGKYGLEIHPEKTQLVDFRHPYRQERGRKPATFSFLGFTHYWGRTRRGGQAVKKKTAKEKLCKAIGVMDDWCKQNRHEKVRVQHTNLCQKIRGHYAYYGVIGNIRSLGRFYEAVRVTWRKWLSRRSSKKAMPWKRYERYLDGPFRLPTPRIIHKAQLQLTLRL